MWLFLGRFCQQLTNADVDAWSHQTELRNLLGELSEGVEEQRVRAGKQGAQLGVALDQSSWPCFGLACSPFTGSSGEGLTGNDSKVQ